MIFSVKRINWDFIFFAGAVDGVFTPWTAWTTCTEPTLCLQGFKTRTRTCTNPPPANGGDDCVGLSQENKDCPTEADGCSGKENIGIFSTQIFCQSCPEMYMYILEIMLFKKQMFSYQAIDLLSADADFRFVNGRCHF